MAIDTGKVRSFWEDHVNNEYYTGAYRESPAYFADIERKRYRYHYHIPETFGRIQELGPQGKRLLEVGCGIGIDTVRLAALGFDEVVGVDLTETAIEIARRRAVREGLLNITYSREDGENLSFPDESFDMVYSFGVIHHTPDIQKAVREIHRVLKPGGAAHIMIYHKSSLVNLIHVLFRLPYESPKELKDHCPVVYRFSRGEARELFSLFDKVQLHTDYPFTYGMRYVSWIFPVGVQRAFGRWFGWHIMIEAQKRK
jgi:ubiquinone/menaquinone biosynthesis C-methylase UbiE